MPDVNRQHRNAPPPLLSLGDACRILGIARSTLYVILDRGDLDIVEIGGRRMVEPAELDRFIAASRRSARGVGA